jgi:prepilin-type processing-associated H-X9-DG protein/prepilin-type N-terminal cleavage/methylation domain-containing protein
MHQIRRQRKPVAAIHRSKRCTCPRAAAFTLIELLVVIAILAVLIALLLPMARGTVRAARGFKCQLAQRAVAFDFQIFADEKLHGPRGNDESLGSRFFRLETFQDSQYSIDEFWAWDNAPEAEFPDAAGNDPMRCPEVRGPITLRRNTPCTGGAIQPPERISFGFNMRLHRPAGPVVRLTSQIMEQRSVPLLWDVDSQVAVDRGIIPVFSAPSMGDTGLLANDRYWFPALRHNGEGNFAFVDGHVATSSRPLAEGDWAWTYRPR